MESLRRFSTEKVDGVSLDAHKRDHVHATRPTDARRGAATVPSLCLRLKLSLSSVAHLPHRPYSLCLLNVLGGLLHLLPDSLQERDSSARNSQETQPTQPGDGSTPRSQTRPVFEKSIGLRLVASPGRTDSIYVPTNMSRNQRFRPRLPPRRTAYPVRHPRARRTNSWTMLS